MQRSDRRVQEIKDKRAAARNGPPSRVLVEGRDPGRAAVQTVPRKETAESQSTTADRKRAERKLRPPPPGRRSSPQIGTDVRISDPDQRKRNLSEMHQRTQRLYEQLEEVKQQRAARSRQEDWARNRLRAKEFHRKTLQKLRAKQTPTF
ncbi:centrosomal protein of 295 kDa-like [Xiphophorus hellerii]|uniref:centrosomal protein of 295 kDa-like n=1 Tax=Xiphophorus hellerii TaxID=8084 RepID=UPI0013B405A1|nr:centrosomal protein of 295 kDa-like [Xiphophorus hellerii]